MLSLEPNTAPPRPPALSSIPAILHTLQNEWDALVLEAFVLKQQNNSIRQELSYALYAQDAATRVVARLIQERDAARECVFFTSSYCIPSNNTDFNRALSNVQASMGIVPANGTSADAEMSDVGEEGGGLPASVANQIEETYQTLSAARKKRTHPSNYATPAQIKKFSARHTIPSLHSSSPAGITSIAISRTNPSHFLTGGNDKIVQLYDRSTDKVLVSLKGHTKKINHVALRERDGDSTLLLSASADKSARIWALDAASGEYIPKSTIRIHKGDITGLAVHPTSTLAALASADKTWSLHDLTNFEPVFRSPESEEAFSSMSLHPDGTLLAVGTPGSTIQIYDVRFGTIAASLVPPDSTPFSVNTLSFSENGYHLLAPDSLSSVAIWDLRKQKVTQSISLGDQFKVNKVVYDYSGRVFGVAGSEGARVYAHKSWEELVRFEEGGEVTDLVFGEQGQEIWGVAGREVRIWGSSE
jgi:pre-mRNA-processing factor 19